MPKSELAQEKERLDKKSGVYQPEHGQAEEVLRYSEARYRALFRDNPTMILTVDTELIILSANPCAAAHLGYTIDELEGMSVLALFHEDDRAAVAERLRGCLKNPDEVHHWQFRKIRKDGMMLWVEEIAQVVYGLDGGVNILVVCQDFTERKLAEAERENLLIELEAVLNSITEGVVIADLEGNVLTMNKAALAINEFTFVEEVQQQLQDYQKNFEIFDLEGHLIPLAQWPLARVLRGESFTDYEVRVHRKDTGKLWIGSFNGTPVQTRSGDVILAVVTLRDVSELEKTQMELQKAHSELEKRVEERTAELRETGEALQKETEERIRIMEALRQSDKMLIQQSRLAAMGEMISNIAHQWRQPLNAIGLIIQELPAVYKKGDFTEEYLNEMVDKAKNLVFSMSQTIEDFRTFFQPNKEKVKFRVRDVFAKTLALVKDSFKTAHIRIEVDVVGDPLIYGYPSEFSQVLLNILLNSRDAFTESIEDKPRTIMIKAFPENGKTAVSITDNAGGMPEDVIEKVFDPYFTTKGPDKGTGIGLFMTKNIIEKHMNGKVSIRNTTDGAEVMIEVAAEASD